MQLNPKTNRQEQQQQSRVPPIFQVLYSACPRGTECNSDEANLKGQIKPDSLSYERAFLLNQTYNNLAWLDRKGEFN